MKISRRKLLLGSGMLTASAVIPLPPVAGLVNSMLKNVLNVAQADSGVGTYIQIALPGAPPRWIFDQILTPSGESIIANPMAATKFTIGANGTISGAAYETMVYKDIRVSPLFGTQVATSGGTRPLSDLLEHMIVFRGYGSGTDGHPTNMARQTNPLATAGSVTGNVADHSNSLFKAIQFPNLGQFSGYSSLKGSGLTIPASPLSGAEMNYAKEILTPFGARAETPNLQSARLRYEDLIADAQSVVSAAFSADRAEFSSLRGDQDQAINKIRSGITGLVDAWPSLYSKYLNIISWAYQDRSAPGYTANAIVPGSDPGSINTPWVIDSSLGPLVAAPDQDIRDWTRSVDVSKIATSFALCEFVITQNLTTAFELHVQLPDNFTIQYIRNLAGPLNSPQSDKSSHIFDQHNTGLLAGFHLNSCLYRGIGGAILELITQLKAKAMFDSTVIHLAQEFGRLPRNTSSGSDHGFDAMVSSVFTGRQKQGPMVLGNIAAQGTRGEWAAQYSNCFGYKALTQVGGKSLYLTPAHVTSSLAVLLNLPVNPWVNVAEPLISVNSAGLRAETTAQVVSG